MPEHHFSPFQAHPSLFSVELQQMLRLNRHVVAQPHPTPFLCRYYFQRWDCSSISSKVSVIMAAKVAASSLRATIAGMSLSSCG